MNHSIFKGYCSVCVDRVVQRRNWLQQQLGDDWTIAPLAGDASFRCYFRVRQGERSYVLMDAPPPHEDVAPFMAVRGWLEAAGLRVSVCYGEERALGFLLLEDFGDRTWARFYAQGGALAPLFQDALHQLHLLQGSKPSIQLPCFDVARMQRECALYLDWYLPYVVGEVADEGMKKGFFEVMKPRLAVLSALPVVPVHLDYHSRNLMLPDDGLPLAVIDYQDALLGPVTYDLASLLYDCYQDYPEAERMHWSHVFYEQLPESLAAYFGGFSDWHRALRLTAMQRHIKAIGIFSRLAYRDGKKQFLDEIPLTRKHLHEEMAALGLSAESDSLLSTAP